MISNHDLDILDQIFTSGNELTCKKESVTDPRSTDIDPTLLSKIKVLETEAIKYHINSIKFMQI